ncbi:MAG TPA: TolC family protein, partial [Chitinophagaceae bacterium]|nr:TolC family protein [Chitinophagaceae bacterium]
MKRLRNSVPVLVALALLPAIGFTQADTAKRIRHEFSVQQAVDYAKKNNVQVKNALLDVLIQEQTNREITAAAYPQISGSLSYIDNTKLAPVVIEGGGFFGGTPGTYQKIPSFQLKNSGSAGLELNQILFDGQVFVGLQARKAVLEFQQKNTEITEEVIKANIYKIYYQLVVSKKQVELLDANIERFDKLLHDTREIYKAGFAEQLDVDKVNVALTNLQTEKLKALNQIANGYLGLKVLMGMPVQDELVLTDTLKEAEIGSAILDAGSFSYTDRKEYQYANLGIKLNEYNIKRYKLSKIPTVSLNAYYNQIRQANSFTLSHGTSYPASAVSLRVNVPIFSGFSTNSKIQKAKLELEKSMNQRSALELSINNEIETAKNNFNSAVASMNYQRRNMELAEKVYNQTKKKYEMGTG